jgi:hypothetical protein
MFFLRNLQTPATATYAQLEFLDAAIPYIEKDMAQ